MLSTETCLSLQQQCDKYWDDVLSVQKHVLFFFRNNVLSTETCLFLQQQCDKYWGDVLSVQKHVQQGDIHIFLDSILELSRLTIRTFHIQKVRNLFLFLLILYWLDHLKTVRTGITKTRPSSVQIFFSRKN